MVSGVNLLAPKIAFCLLFLGCSLLIWWTGHTLAGPTEGILAALLTVASPMLRAFSATIQYEILTTFLLTASLTLTVLSIRVRSHTWSACLFVTASFAVGLSALTREVTVLALPVLIVVFWLGREGSILSRLIPIAGSLRVVGLLFAGWILVVYQQTQQWIPVSEKSPLVLRLGNNPNANGTLHQQRYGISEPTGWDFMIQEPRETARLAVRKFLYFWGILKDPWNVPRVGSLILTRLSFNLLPIGWSHLLARGGILFLLFVIGTALIAARKRYRPLWFAPVLVGLLLALHLVYFSSHRSAVPVLPVIFLAASLGPAVGLRVLLRAFDKRILASGATVLLATSVLAGFRELRGSWTIEAEDLDGMQIADVVDPSALNGRARLATAAEGRRLAAFLTEEYFPRGRFQVKVRMRTSPGTVKRPLPDTSLETASSVSSFGHLERSTSGLSFNVGKPVESAPLLGEGWYDSQKAGRRNSNALPVGR